MHENKIKAAIFGSSGYTGAEAVRLLLAHPRIEIAALCAHSRAGEPYSAIYPQFAGMGLPDTTRIDETDLSGIDVVFSCLPHGTGQAPIAKALKAGLIVIDVSADFRLQDPALFASTYGQEHSQPDLLQDRVYGLTEYARGDLPGAKLVACPGCYPTCSLLALLPGIEAGLIADESIIIDAKTGVTGAGRKASLGFMFSELQDGAHAYAVGNHRHAPEIEQELARLGHGSSLTFTPHLVPMNRGMIATCYVTLKDGVSADDLRSTMAERYSHDPFVLMMPDGEVPQTRHVRGTNQARIGVFQDRVPGRAIIISVIDNLTKGSSGQAVQNLNLVMGWDERLGLENAALFP